MSVTLDKGGVAEVAIGDAGAALSACTPLSNHALAIDSLATGRAGESRPNRDWDRMERGATSDYSIGFDVDADDVTVGLIAGQIGKRKRVYVMRKGMVAGRPMVAFDGVMDETENQPFGTSHTFNVSIMGDGPVQEGTVSGSLPALQPHAATYKGRNQNFLICSQPGELIQMLPSGPADGGVTISPTMEYLVSTFGEAYAQRVRRRGGGSFAIGTIYGNAVSDLMAAISHDDARADAVIVAVKAEYGWWVSSVFLEEPVTGMPFDNFIDYQQAFPWVYDEGKGLRNAIPSFARIATGATNAAPVLDITSDANDVAVAPPTGYATDTGQIVAIVSGTASGDSTKNLKLAPAAGNNESAAIPMRDGIYRVLNVPASITKVKKSSAPTGEFKLTLLFTDVVEV